MAYIMTSKHSVQNAPLTRRPTVVLENSTPGSVNGPGHRVAYSPRKPRSLASER